MSNQSEHALHLSVDQLAAHLEHRLHGAERESVVSHLVECGECRREYIEAGAVVGAARPRWVGFRTGIGLAAAAAVVFAILPRAFPPAATTLTPDVSMQRTSLPDVPAPIRLAAPADGERLTGSGVRLSWHPDGVDVLYRVTVQTDAGAVVWKTETHDTSYSVPRDVPLTRGVKYYWIVDALHADGRPTRSPANSFIR
jgi:hypothetical protein